MIDFKKETLPDAPGVYFFKQGSSVPGGRRGKEKILYIGKATSLRDRVCSYFAKDLIRTRGSFISTMVSEATYIDHIVTDSVLEALILEAALIKRYQPYYNTKEKSGTSFNYVVITDEEYPRVFTMRERELLTTDYRFLAQYGPFPHGGQLRDALKIIRKIFPYRGKTDAPIPAFKRRASRLYEEIGLAPKLITTTKEEYRRTIRHVRLFFEGKKKELIRTLTHEMKIYAKNREFEKADEIKRRLFALGHINDVALIRHSAHESALSGTRIEGYDISHMTEKNRVGVMVVIDNGEAHKSDYRMFKIKSLSSRGDTGALREVLERRLNHSEWMLPRLIVVDGGEAQKKVAEQVLETFGYQIPVVAVTKNEHHRPQRIIGQGGLIKALEGDILLANSEAHRFAIQFHRKRRSQIT